METAVVRVTAAPVVASRSMTPEQVTQALPGRHGRSSGAPPRWVRLRWTTGTKAGYRVVIWLPLPHRLLWSSPSPTSGSTCESVRTTACQFECLPALARGCRSTRGHRAGRGQSSGHRHRLVGGAAWPGVMAGGSAASADRRGTVGNGPPVSWRAVSMGWLLPLRLDCSGFVQLVHRLHGVRLPRDADQQALVGNPIEPSVRRHPRWRRGVLRRRSRQHPYHTRRPRARRRDVHPRRGQRSRPRQCAVRRPGPPKADACLSLPSNDTEPVIVTTKALRRGRTWHRFRPTATTAIPSERVCLRVT